MILLLALALNGVGFTALALAMDRHHRQVWHRLPTRRLQWLMRVVGIVGLGAALAVCVANAGWSVGILLWLGLLSIAAPAVALVLSYRPQVLAAIALAPRAHSLRR